MAGGTFDPDGVKVLVSSSLESAVAAADCTAAGEFAFRARENTFKIGFWMGGVVTVSPSDSVTGASREGCVVIMSQMV
jgi:hypothetical protein